MREGKARGLLGVAPPTIAVMRGGGWDQVGDVSGRSVAGQVARYAIPLLLVALLIGAVWWLYSSSGAERPYLASDANSTTTAQANDTTSTAGSGSTVVGSSPATIIDLTEELPDSVQSTLERFEVVEISFGETCEKLLAALSSEQRREGLRGNEDSLDHFDGMVFAFDEEREVGFTMAGVTKALDIGFYASDGTLVDRLAMVPCDDTTEECPIYRSTSRFQYAVEAAAGKLPEGNLAACNGDPIDTIVTSQ